MIRELSYPTRILAQLITMYARFSFDGMHWTSMRLGLRCGAIGDRSLDHPASPAMVKGKGKDEGKVHIYIQHNVPSIGLDRMTPWQLVRRRISISHEHPFDNIEDAFFRPTPQSPLTSSLWSCSTRKDLIWSHVQQSSDILLERVTFSTSLGRALVHSRRAPAIRKQASSIVCPTYAVN